MRHTVIVEKRKTARRLRNCKTITENAINNTHHGDCGIAKKQRGCGKAKNFFNVSGIFAAFLFFISIICTNAAHCDGNERETQAPSKREIFATGAERVTICCQQCALFQKTGRTLLVPYVPPTQQHVWRTFCFLRVFFATEREK